MWLLLMCCHLTYCGRPKEHVETQIQSELSLMMHITISSDNTLHFYWYLRTHVLIADRQFLLLIHVSIQNRG